MIGLNEYIDAERTNRFKAAKVKRETQDAMIPVIRMAINKGELHRHETKCALIIEWTEKNNRRDADNISFATKFIQDALVECGVFPDDNRKYIADIHHKFQTGNDYQVKVTIEEMNNVINQRIYDSGQTAQSDARADEQRDELYSVVR